MRDGEILGIAGVQGNGQTELTEAILGLQARRGLDRARRRRTARAVGAATCSTPGVGFVPEDRKEDGLVAEFSIAENLMLDRSDGAPFVEARHAAARPSRGVRRGEGRRSSTSAPRASATHVGASRAATSRRSCSRASSAATCSCFVAAQPTRGLDVGSIEFVHTRIVAARDAGIPVIVVSTELDEVVALADRIAVMYHGRHRRRSCPATPRARCSAS